MRTAITRSRPARLTRRALLGRLLALPLLPALTTLAACTPGGQTGRQSEALAPTSAPGSSGGGMKTLGVATVYPYLGYLPLYAAIQRGHLRDRGLALELTEFKGGGDAGKAFVGGAADVLIGSYDHVLKLREQGLDVVATDNVEAMYAYALMAKRGSPYTGLESLQGRRLGTTGPGSSTDINLRYGLKQHDIDPDRQVELISVGGAARCWPRSTTTRSRPACSSIRC
jgi:ABC-type nitrate/sulfonate/bicarbonate transport system substrate-binding protein